MPLQQPVFLPSHPSALTSETSRKGTAASELPYTDLVDASFDAKASLSDEVETSLDSTLHKWDGSMTKGGLEKGDFPPSSGPGSFDSGEIGVRGEEELKMRNRGKEGGKTGMGPRREARMKGERTGRGKK